MNHRVTLLTGQFMAWSLLTSHFWMDSIHLEPIRTGAKKVPGTKWYPLMENPKNPVESS